jgi:hypothetical protein
MPLDNFKKAFPAYAEIPDTELLGKIKAKYPAYAQLEDDDLASRLEKRFAPGFEPVHRPAVPGVPAPGAPPTPPGVEPGNLNPEDRGFFTDSKNGTWGNLRSKSFNLEGKETLLPTVDRNGTPLTDAQALTQYATTKQHLGRFNTPEEANAHAEQLHAEQAKRMVKPPTMDWLSVKPVKDESGNPSISPIYVLNLPQGSLLIPGQDKNGTPLSERNAVLQFGKTKEHLGIFRSMGDAVKYKNALSQEQKVEYNLPGKNVPLFTPNTIKPPTEKDYKINSHMTDPAWMDASLHPNKTLTAIDVGKQVYNNPSKVLPFAHSVVDFKNYIDLGFSLYRIEMGMGTPEDVKSAKDFLAFQKMHKNWTYETANIVVDSIPFMAEFGLTEGTFNVGEKVAMDGAKYALKRFVGKEGVEKLESLLAEKSVKGTALRLAKHELGKLGGATARSVVTGLASVPARVVEAQLPKFHENEKGDIVVTGETEPIHKSIINAVTSNWIETASEEMGDVFPFLKGELKQYKWFNKISDSIKDAAMKQAVIKSIIERNKLPGVAYQKIGNFLRKGRYNGILGEMYEEQVGAVWYGLAHELGISDQKFEMPTMRDLAIQFVGFGVPGVAQHVGGHGIEDRKSVV